MDTLFNVSYYLKKTEGRTGEFSDSHHTHALSFLSESNDLNEIFTDLFELHRYEGIIGIEIRSVMEVDNKGVLQEVFNTFYA